MAKLGICFDLCYGSIFFCTVIVSAENSEAEFQAFLFNLHGKKITWYSINTIHEIAQVNLKTENFQCNYRSNHT